MCFPLCPDGDDSTIYSLTTKIAKVTKGPDMF
jgi:hypothetical protein